ncbi:MAG: hypothetical protein WC397_00515 [Candidatus Paceibacterota bacterium]|jgi:hypothetical protein
MALDQTILQSLPQPIAPFASAAIAASVPYFLFLWEILKLFWWIIPPFILFSIVKGQYLDFIQGIWADKLEFVTLELKIPREELKPIKAMENVFSNLFGTRDSPSGFKDKWIDGKVPVGFSLEIASVDGNPHFYIRVLKGLRKAIESAIYSQYAGIEICEVPDYAKDVPADIPNKEWDVWGSDYTLARPDVYPIKTYSQFFEESQGLEEGERIDPLSSLIEGMVRLEKGEQIWMQFMITPVSNDDNNYVDRGKEEVNKIMKRPGKTVFKPLIQEAFDFAAFGDIPGGPTAAAAETPHLTSGEKDVLKAIEDKVSKCAYSVGIRAVYVAKKDVFSSSSKTIPAIFLAQFATQSLNAIKSFGATSVRAPAFALFAEQKTYLRKKDMFGNYLKRKPASGSTFILNTEEMATLFHFPGILSIPGSIMPRIATKKGIAPLELPTE